MSLFARLVRHPAGLAVGAATALMLAPLGAGSAAAVARAAVPTDRYGAAVAADGASTYWRLDETAGSEATDAISGDTRSGTYTNGVALGQAGSPAGPTGTAIRLPGNSTEYLAATDPVSNPGEFSLELWFRTDTSSGGRLIGFGNARTGISTQRDRMLYMVDSGRLRYGVYAQGIQTIESPLAYNDDEWHHAVATQSPAGQRLFVDGVQVAAGTTPSGQNYTGYWRLGTDATWPGASSPNLAGTIDEAAIYPAALSATQVQRHFTLAATGPGQPPPTSPPTSPTTGPPTTVPPPTTGPPPNLPPTAIPSLLCVDLNCTFDGSSSRDPDGRITDYAWTFGDGTTATTATGEHRYPRGGRYAVTLTVTDDDGATGASSTAVIVTDPNQPPVAAFTSDCLDLTCTLDAADSGDADGTLTRYAWTFGDGTTGTGVRPSHTWTQGGTFTVTLRVTDDDGASDAVSHGVTVVDPVLAVDRFGRTVPGGLGQADRGGPWTWSGTAYPSVTGGSARLALSGSQTGAATLDRISNLNTDLTSTVWLESAPLGNGVYVGNTVRTGLLGSYRARVRITGTTTSVQFVRAVALLDTLVGPNVVVPDLTYTAGTRLRIRSQAFRNDDNATTLRAKVWVEGTPEPSAWTVTTADALVGYQGAGAVGIWSYAASNSGNPVVRFDDIEARILHPQD